MPLAHCLAEAGVNPLPRTVIPVPGEYHLDYLGKLAEANHLELTELTGPAAILHHPGSLDTARAWTPGGRR